MQMPGRKYSSSSYRYGFNGKEKDNEVSGDGNQYDYGFRIYNPRIGRFLSVDPLTNKYPELTPYQFASNMPIIAIDLDGEEAKIVIIYHGNNGIANRYERTVPSFRMVTSMFQTEVVNTIHRVRVDLPNGKTKWVDVTGIFAPEKPVSFQTGRIDLTNQGLNKASSNFEKYQAKVFDHEGGFTDDPDDPGGATNKGITFNTFKLYAQSDLGIKPTLENLKSLTNDQAAVIYKNNYWNNVKGDQIKNASVAYAVYDFNVNAGGNAITVLQKTLNEMGANLTVDGAFGQKTLDAINSVDSKELFDKFQANRKQYYQDIIQKNSKLKKYEKGWNNRVNSIKYEE